MKMWKTMCPGEPHDLPTSWGPGGGPVTDRQSAQKHVQTLGPQGANKGCLCFFCLLLLQVPPLLPPLTYSMRLLALEATYNQGVETLSLKGAACSREWARLAASA